MATPTKGDWVKLYHHILRFPDHPPIRTIQVMVEKELRKVGLDPVKIKGNTPWSSR